MVAVVIANIRRRFVVAVKRRGRGRGPAAGGRASPRRGAAPGGNGGCYLQVAIERASRRPAGAAAPPPARQRRRPQTLDGESGTDGASVQAGVYRKTLEMRRDEARRKGIAGAGRINDLRRAAEPPMKAVFPGVVQNAASRSLLEDDEPETAGCQPGKHPLRVDLGLLEEQLVLTREKSVDFGQSLPPVLERLLGNRQVRIDRHEAARFHGQRRKQSALRRERHWSEVECGCRAPGSRDVLGSG